MTGGNIEMEVLPVFVASCMCAESASQFQTIQSLWSGYGEICRMKLKGCSAGSKFAVVKQISPPKTTGSCSLSHSRKCKSYDVETHFYKQWGKALSNVGVRIPACFGARSTESGGIWLVLEDLNESGYSARTNNLDETKAKLCLKWLARFHAFFLGHKPEGLWDIGTYWHLDTRPDEFAAMSDDDELKSAACDLDRELRSCRFQTLVHGDAKAENFCFSSNLRDVATVDFQYVGGGCGVKDVCYLLSCMNGWRGPDQSTEDRLLDFYFHELRLAVSGLPRPASPRARSTPSGPAPPAHVDVDALEREWRRLYPLAVADYARFMAGWDPTYGSPAARDPRTRRHCAAALQALTDGAAAA